MDAHADCGACGAGIEVPRGAPVPEECPDCETSLNWHPEGYTNGDVLEHCLKCGRDDFYAQTQINPNFGVALVVIGAITFAVLVYAIPGMDGFLWGTVVLLSLALVDRLLRLVLPEVVICYHCSAVYTDVDPDQAFEAYDHEKAADVKYSD